MKQIKIATIVQARVSSSRLPGKVLLPVLERPILSLMIERLKRSKFIDKIIVATSISPEDDAIVELCKNENIDFYRGSLNDLLDRHYKCSLEYKADAVAKIPSDCPLIDPAVVDNVYNYFIESYPKYDYVSNLHPASYPDGNDVEIMKFSALETAWKNATKDFEREHTTPYIWENPDLFSIGNVKWDANLDYSTYHRWTLDYYEDYLFIKAVYENLYPIKQSFGIYDILELVEKRKDIFNLNSHLAGVNWYRHYIGQLKTIEPNMTKMYP